jgi:hypothetical protein
MAHELERPGVLLRVAVWKDDVGTAGLGELLRDREFRLAQQARLPGRLPGPGSSDTGPQIPATCMGVAFSRNTSTVFFEKNILRAPRPDSAATLSPRTILLLILLIAGMSIIWTKAVHSLSELRR